MTLAHASTVARDAEASVGRARFARLDAAWKIAGGVLYAVAVAVVANRTLACAALAFSLTILLVSGLPLRLALRRLAPVASMALVLSASVGWIRGLPAFELLFVRILAATVLLLAVALTTPPIELAAGLRRLRVPALLTSTLLLTYRYLFLFDEEAGRMRRAGEARGFRARGSLRSRGVFQTLSTFAGGILVRAHRRSQAVHRAMLARHFHGDLPVPHGHGARAPDVALFVAIAVVSAWLIGASAGVIPWPR